jgi:hypothetical protein
MYGVNKMINERTYNKYESTLSGSGFKKTNKGVYTNSDGHKIHIDSGKWYHMDPAGKLVKMSDNTPDLQDHIKNLRFKTKTNEGVEYKMSKVERIIEKYLGESKLLGENVPPIDATIPDAQKTERNIAVDKSGEAVQKTPVSAPTKTHQAVTDASHAFLMKIQELVHSNNDPKNIVAAIKQHLYKFKKVGPNQPAPEPVKAKAVM